MLDSRIEYIIPYQMVPLCYSQPVNYSVDAYFSKYFIYTPIKPLIIAHKKCL